jgi:cephalosporin-C deacetylase
MPISDLPLAELETFKAEIHLPKDFDEFWNATLESSRAKWQPPTLEKVDFGITAFEVYDVTFSGFESEPIKGWYILPKNSKPTHAVVEYLGYGGGRGFPHEHLKWPSAGFAHFVMDTRGQGGEWGSGGGTPDNHGSHGHHPGFMTKGIESKETYYYRRVYTDAVLAVDFVRSLNVVDPKNIIVAGGSQGGGISLAVAGLVKDLFAVLPEVPFLSYFRRAAEITPLRPYLEISKYLSIHRDKYENTFNTLDYFDTLNFVRNATAPAYFSVALMDTICPPSTVFAVKNNYAGKAKIEVFRFNDHEGGQGHHWMNQMKWLRSLGVQN